MREMKDSGIEWIGEIPQEWYIARLRDIKAEKKYAIVDGPFGSAISTNDYKESGIPLIRITNLKNGEVTEEDMVYISEELAEEVGRSSIGLSDIIFAKTGATIGKCGVNKTIKYGILASSCVKISILDKFDHRFFYYVFFTDQFNEAIRNTCTGTTRDTINLSPFSKLNVVIPPYKLQQRIADYLDRKCSQIDAIIARQQEVIEKLKAYKLSVITEAVTKGLNPDVPMKDSGDDFIGVMPEHWNIAKLGMLFDFLGGYAYNSDSYTSESDNQVIRIGNVKSGYMALENNPVYISDEIASATDKFRINPGSILFTMTGTKGKRDYFFTHLVAEEDCKGKKLFLNQRVGCFIPKESIDAGYYNYLLKENRILDAIFVYETGTANQGNLGIESIRRTKVQLPSKDEQVKIREYLDNRCAKIEGLLSRKSEIICRLMAYKKSLIYEVVTGKKEV